MATEYVEGASVLKKAFEELADMGSKDWKATMNSAVRVPMTSVRKKAAGNLAAISPGKAKWHLTYKGRLVGAGFASRNLKLVVKVNPKKGTATAILGVVREAFYVLSFFELGTAYIPRHPWLTPAMESSTDTMIAQVGAAMRKRIDAIAKKRMRESVGAGK